MLSEFLLISVWTWFKAQDDFFSIYNSLPISKFSIFQKVSSDSNDAKKDNNSIKNRITSGLTSGEGRGRQDTEEDEDQREYSDSLLSRDRPDENDSRKKSNFDKRSI